VLSRPDARCGIVRIEQLYPFPVDELRASIGRHPALSEVVWVQEEARNHGAWFALREPLEDALPPGCRLRCVARPEAAASAGCGRSRHAAEQAALISGALREAL